MTSRSSYSDLFLSFAKVGLFTFGGGYAMIPIIESLCVEKRRWLTAEEMAQTIVISNSTPGPIAINCATFVGFKQRGWLGALAATAGICLPSFIIIFLIALYFRDFLQYRPVAAALEGIKTAVGLLVIQAGLKMIRQQEKNALSYTVLILTCLALAADECGWLPISSAPVMLAAAAVSMMHHAIYGEAEAEADAPPQAPSLPEDGQS